MSTHAELLTVLADPLRLQLLRELLEAPRCVSDLTSAADALQPRVSRHLGLLRDAGLVTCEADGRRRCYRLARPSLVRDLLAFLETHGGPS